MFRKLFHRQRDKRKAEVLRHLQSLARDSVSEARLHKLDAITRAYTIALSETLPGHTVSCAFPESIYPPWDDKVWRKAFSIFEDLSVMLAWSLCLSAFSDLDELVEPDSIERARQALMFVSGSFCEVSDRAEALTRRYRELEVNKDARQEFFTSGYVPLEAALAEVPHLVVHAWMVNEALDEPPLSSERSDPEHILGLKLYLAELEIAAMDHFRPRARELCEKFVVTGAVAVAPSTRLAGSAHEASPMDDPYCPNTDASRRQLIKEVQLSPHHATNGIGTAVLAHLEAYLQCASDSRKAGDEWNYVFAVSQASELFEFSARNSDALGDGKSAVTVLKRGKSILAEALASGAGSPESRNRIRENSTKISELLRQLGSI